MLALQREAVTRLAADSELVTLAIGGVLNRWIKPGQGQGATPGVFYVDPTDPAKLPRMHPTIVVLAGGDNPSPRAEVQGAWFRALAVHLFVEATQSGKDRADAMDWRVMTLLTGEPLMVERGFAVVSPLTATEPIDLDGFPGMLTMQRRFAAEYVREAA